MNLVELDRLIASLDKINDSELIAFYSAKRKDLCALIGNKITSKLVGV